MTIERDSEICRLYLWSLGLCEEFSGHNKDALREKTNLCHFVRTIVVYMPLIILSELCVWCAVLFATIIQPIRLWGFGGYSGTLVIIALTVGAIYGVIRFASYLEDLPPRPRRTRSKSQTRLVLEAYVHAKKQRICPLISIVGGENA